MMAILFTHPLKVRLDPLQDLLRLARRIARGEPFDGITVEFARITRVRSVFFAMAKRNDVFRYGSWTVGSGQWYPVIGSESMPQTDRSSADGATIIEIGKRTSPVLSAKPVVQVPLASTTTQGCDCGIGAILFTKLRVVLSTLIVSSSSLPLLFFKLRSMFIGISPRPPLLSLFVLVQLIVSLAILAFLVTLSYVAFVRLGELIFTVFAVVVSTALLILFSMRCAIRSILRLLPFSILVRPFLALFPYLLSIGIVVSLSTGFTSMLKTVRRMTRFLKFAKQKMGFAAIASLKRVRFVNHRMSPHAHHRVVVGGRGGETALSVISLADKTNIPLIAATR